MREGERMASEVQVDGIFLSEAVSQIDTALRADQRVLIALRLNHDDGFWDAVDQLLTSSVRCVNIFWTRQSGEPSRRANRLRARFGLPEAPPSPTLRDVRNGFEHFDERIDAWAAKSLGVYIGRTRIDVDAPLSSLITVGDGRVPQHEIFARLYRANGELHVFSKAVSLTALVHDLTALRAKLVPHTPSGS